MAMYTSVQLVLIAEKDGQGFFHGPRLWPKLHVAMHSLYIEYFRSRMRHHVCLSICLVFSIPSSAALIEQAQPNRITEHISGAQSVHDAALTAMSPPVFAHLVVTQ